MMDKVNNPDYELDLFDFIKILLKRKYLILLIFGAAAILTGIYCYGLRGEIPTSYKIQMIVRFPHPFDVISQDPDNPEQRINIGNKAVSIIQSGAIKGKLQEHFKMESLPQIGTGLTGPGLSLLILELHHPDKEEGKRIIGAVHKFLRSEQIIQNLLKTEENLIIAEINKYKTETEALAHKISRLETDIGKVDNLLKANKEWMNRLIQDIGEETAIEFIRLFEKQFQQLAVSQRVYHDLLYRLMLDGNRNRRMTGKFENKLENIKKVFEPEGPISSTLVQSKRISNRKIIAMAGIIGLALGIFVAFILEMRARRLGQ